jgi:hypothetical protein
MRCLRKTHLLIVLTSMATSNGPEPFGIFVLARVPLGAVKNSVSENDYVLFCTAAMKRKRTRRTGGLGGGSERGTNNLTLEYQ